MLLRSFPLKSIRLHKAWDASFTLLSSGHSVRFDKIIPCVNTLKPENIEKFFNGLVRKGFLERSGDPIIEHHPLVSVIIPVHNRPEEIKACLMSLDHLDYPSDKLEIIVVDDASNDQTVEVIKKFNVELISLKTNHKAPFCRNLAAERAEGEILAFLDSDCVVSPSWLTELVPVFRDPEVGVVGGRIDSFFNTTGLDRYEQVSSSLIMGNHDKRSDKRERFFYVPSCNLLARKKTFHAVNGFNPDLVVGEDVDLCWRIQDSGKFVEFRPGGVVWHRHRNELGAFSRRRFDYGTSEPLLQKLHPDRKKIFFFPIGGFLFWCAFFVSFFQGPLFLAICPVIALIDSGIKYHRTRQISYISFVQHLVAVIRSYATLFYHIASFLSRYYLWACLPAAFILPGAGVGLLYMHALTGIINYTVKKPLLNPVSYLFYFTFEQVSYQAGVWYGAVKNFSFRSLIPVITFLKKSS